MVPLFVAIVLFPAAGLVAAVGAAGVALHRKKLEEEKAGKPAPPKES